MTTRRHFLRGAAAAGLAGLALDRPAAFAQKRELTFLSWNHFVPAADDELRKQAEAFGKQANCTVRVDTVAHLQMPAKIAAEAQSQSGHDMFRSAGADPFLYENQLANLDGQPGAVVGLPGTPFATPGGGANRRVTRGNGGHLRHRAKVAHMGYAQSRQPFTV